MPRSEIIFKYDSKINKGSQFFCKYDLFSFNVISKVHYIDVYELGSPSRHEEIKDL